MTKVWFDMDGTIADLYAVEGWLDSLRAFDPKPYAKARPMLNMSVLARQINAIQRKGIQVGIISWLSKESNTLYDIQVERAKREWLAKYLPSVEWDIIKIVPYGTPKHSVCVNGILFDDEQGNRDKWNIYAGTAFEPCHINEVLSLLNH